MNIERFYIFDWLGVFELPNGDLNEDLVEMLLAIPNVRLAIVSNSSKRHIKRLLKGSGLKFTHILGAEQGMSKSQRIKYICYDWAIDPTAVYFFTDTADDVLEAKKVMAESKIYGCAWGFDRVGLESVLPAERILTQPQDLKKIRTETAEIKKISYQDFRRLLFTPEQLSLFFNLSAMLVMPVLGGLFLGSYLDKQWQSTPWMLLGLTIFGFFVSMALVIRQIKRFSANEQSNNTTGN